MRLQIGVRITMHQQAAVEVDSSFGNEETRQLPMTRSQVLQAVAIKPLHAAFLSFPILYQEKNGK